MAEGREITDEERRAVRRVERAIKAMPETIGLYFHGDTASVLDWTSEPDARDLRASDLEQTITTPRCKAGDW